MNKNKESLGSRLKKAASQGELSSLLAVGAGFVFAAPATRRKWARVAQAKTIAFESAAATKKSAPHSSPSSSAVPVKPARKRNKVNKAKKGAA